ncbi:hypothetical protein ABW20_dc0103880 [Dactylellina cionopaga]|nr:hypothetical protein ABW20_dc0103880 [Dactylellina cionopaga]
MKQIESMDCGEDGEIAERKKEEEEEEDADAHRRLMVRLVVMKKKNKKKKKGEGEGRALGPEWVLFLAEGKDAMLLKKNQRPGPLHYFIILN